MSADNETRQSAAAGGGPVLRCEEAGILLMGYIDDELQPAEVRRIEDHLAVCVSCRREEQGFRRLEEVTEEMLNEELPALNIDAAWETIYQSLERQVGWLLFSAGTILLAGYFGWIMFNEFFLDPDVPLVVRLGAGGMLGGMIVLLVSIGREVLTKYHGERYREVKR